VLPSRRFPVFPPGRRSSPLSSPAAAVLLTNRTINPVRTGLQVRYVEKNKAPANRGVGRCRREKAGVGLPAYSSRSATVSRRLPAARSGRAASLGVGPSDASEAARRSGQSAARQRFTSSRVSSVDGDGARRAVPPAVAGMSQTVRAAYDISQHCGVSLARGRRLNVASF
jgi:hypothetical protein